MRKISVYIISLLLASTISAYGQEEAQPVPDSVDVDLRIRAGLEVAGPVIYFTDRNSMNLEGFAALDINEKISAYAGGGYSDFLYSQYNYEFTTKGPFFKAGADFNFLRPEMAEGKYWAGAGVRYGLSLFTFETTSFSHDNYWGRVSSALPAKTNWAHYLEVAGGFRAELFNNFSIGWLISVRKMIYTGADKAYRPVYYPGYGSSTGTLSFGISYYLSWSIPYKKIRVQIKPEPVEEEEDEEAEPGTSTDFSNIGRQGLGR
ncbi:MAG: DUF6048 family protein [Bacteroidales bacterium]|nr:DUF6048 family protein [Bacteroidales bacterium]